jgi:DNA repair ATPase RecN
VSSSEFKELLMNYLNSRSMNYDNFKSVFEQAKKNTNLLTTARAATALDVVFDELKKDNDALKLLVQTVYLFSDEIDRLRQQSITTDRALVYVINKLQTIESDVNDKKELSNLRNRVSVVEKENKKRRNTFKVIDNYAKSIKTRRKKILQKDDLGLIK